MVPFYQLKMLRTFVPQSGENLLPPRGSSLVRTIINNLNFQNNGKFY